VVLGFSRSELFWRFGLGNSERQEGSKANYQQNIFHDFIS
jgi:hypothetical protein